MPMNSAQLETTGPENARLVPVEPYVKSAETRELSLRGMSRISQNGKNADPPCYNAPVSRKADPAVDAAGLFENQIRRLNMQTIAWTKGRGQWTATVGKIKCTILPPNPRDPLPYYWWETAGPASYWNRRGGGSSLKIAQRMVAESLDESERMACRDPANITNLSLSEVGI